MSNPQPAEWSCVQAARGRKGVRARRISKREYKGGCLGRSCRSRRQVRDGVNTSVLEQQIKRVAESGKAGIAVDVGRQRVRDKTCPAGVRSGCEKLIYRSVSIRRSVIEAVLGGEDAAVGSNGEVVNYGFSSPPWLSAVLIRPVPSDWSRLCSKAGGRAYAEEAAPRGV